MLLCDIQFCSICGMEEMVSCEPKNPMTKCWFGGGEKNFQSECPRRDSGEKGDSRKI